MWTVWVIDDENRARRNLEITDLKLAMERAIVWHKEGFETWLEYQSYLPVT